MYYQKEIDEIEKELDTNESGLFSKQVEERQEKYGKNKLPKKKKTSIFVLFLKQFIDPILFLLFLAIVFSFLVGETFDAFAILFIILLDAIMGCYQENKANNTMDSLLSLVVDKTKVIRDGKEMEIDSSDLTIGDYVLFDSGEKVTADLRLVKMDHLLVDESTLTGESVSVRKQVDAIKKENCSILEQKNMLFAGTTVVSGRGEAIVVKIGLDTELGKIAKHLHNTKEEKSPLTIRVSKFSKQISLFVLIIGILIAFFLFLKKVEYHEIFLSVIALSVSAMPEGLPLALTMALTIASSKMSKKQVVVRKLNSVESLGSCTVIASDKTGTLTVNSQTAKKIILPNGMEYQVTGEGYKAKGNVIGEKLEYAKELALLGMINNEAKLGTKNIGDSIDLAFLVLARKLHINDNVKIIKKIPYESEKRYSSVFYEKDGDIYCTVKGSFEVVKSVCNKVQLTKEKITSNFLDTQNEELSKEGYRVICLATGKVRRKKEYRESDIKNLTFMGMVAFLDPIRKEALKAIKECQDAGIKVLMITGDHPLTAYHIGKELHLAADFDEVTTGDEIDQFLKRGKKVFDAFVLTKKIFTRVTPMQKLEIVASLKRQGEFVAVTGDGVNDAPALKSANIGVAMGSGTDLAREVSNMIVLDDNFKSIVSGVREGRIAYANIRKIIFFLISCGVTEVVFFLLSILFDLPTPLLAIQLLWLNVVTDGIQDFALSFEEGEKDIMKEKPRSPKENLFDKRLWEEILVSGLSMSLIVFLVWYFLIKHLQMDLSLARSYIMTLMVFLQNVHVFNCRSEKKSAFSVSLKSNKLIVVGVIGSVLLHLFIMKVSFLSNLLKTPAIPYLHLIYLLFLSFSIIVIVEIYKKVTGDKRYE